MKKALAFFLMMGLAHTAFAEEAQVSKVTSGIKMVEAQIDGTGFEVNGQIIVTNPELKVGKLSMPLVANAEDLIKAAGIVCASINRDAADYQTALTRDLFLVYVNSKGTITVFKNSASIEFVQLISVTCK